MRQLTEYLMEANSRYKIYPVVHKIITDSKIESICKEITKNLNGFGIENIIVRPTKWQYVPNGYGAIPKTDSFLILDLDVISAETDVEYVANYVGRHNSNQTQSEKVKQFDNEYGTKETSYFGMNGAVDVTKKFSDIPDNVHIYAQNHLEHINNRYIGKFNILSFSLVILIRKHYKNI